MLGTSKIERKSSLSFFLFLQKNFKSFNENRGTRIYLSKL